MSTSVVYPLSLTAGPPYGDCGGVVVRMMEVTVALALSLLLLLLLFMSVSRIPGLAHVIGAGRCEVSTGGSRWTIWTLYTYLHVCFYGHRRGAMWHAKCDIITNTHFWAYTWKQKLNSMYQGSTLSMWHNYKYSLLPIDMRTKVVQHVPRIMWHVKGKMWQVTCDIITNTFELTHENKSWSACHKDQHKHVTDTDTVTATLVPSFCHVDIFSC